MTPTRRPFLKALAALGLAASLPARADEVLDAARGRVRLTNVAHFTDTSGLVARWELLLDGAVARGALLESLLLLNGLLPCAASSA